MNCTFQTGISVLFCKARTGVYIPILKQRMQFCMNTGYPCPATPLLGKAECGRQEDAVLVEQAGR